MGKETEEVGFGFTKEQTDYEEYLGTYIMIYPKSGSYTFVGKLTKIERSKMTLNPFVGVYYPDKGYPVKTLIYKKFKWNISDISGIEPTTRRSIDNYCRLSNNKGNLQKQITQD